MGRDKARLEVGGIPLWRRQAGILVESGADPVRLVLRVRQHSFGWRGGELRDPRPDAGPLAGIVAALGAADCALTAVLAVDLPRIESDWFIRLRRRARAGRGVVVHGPQGFEPLAALYPRAALGIAGARLATSRFALQGLITELVDRGLMTVVTCRPDRLRQLENWNSPADRARSSVP